MDNYKYRSLSINTLQCGGSRLTHRDLIIARVEHWRLWKSFVWLATSPRTGLDSDCANAGHCEVKAPLSDGVFVKLVAVCWFYLCLGIFTRIAKTTRPRSPWWKPTETITDNLMGLMGIVLLLLSGGSKHLEKGFVVMAHDGVNKWQENCIEL